MSSKLSIVVPVYNSEKSLELLCDSIEKELSDLDYEIVFVDDASVDKSWEILKQIKERTKVNTKAIRLETNVGQHRATLIGFTKCLGDTIITIDDDLQHSPAEIKKLLEEHISQKNEITYGVYLNKKKHSIFRNSISLFIKYTTRFFTAHQKTEGSSFRILSKTLASSLIQDVDNFVYIEEAIHTYTKSIGFASIHHVKRTHSKSTYTIKKLFKLFVDILTVYCMPRIKQVLLLSFLMILLWVYFYSVIVSTFLLLVSLPFITFCLFAFSVCVYCQFNSSLLKHKTIPHKIKESYL